MLKNVVLGFVFFFFILFSTHVIVRSEEINIEGNKVEYTLPYPGILPDSEIYFVKSLRDNILVFLTRDNIKKAELELLISDKKNSMAMELAKKSKWHYARKILFESLENFDNSITSIKESKNQGGGIGEELIPKLESSNRKQKEIVETMLKDIPYGEVKNFEEILRKNQKFEQILKDLKK